MTMEHITPTGERWHSRGGIIEVGLSPAMQKEIGAARFIQLPAIGTSARASEHLGVVEGALSAAEFYALRWPRGLGCAVRRAHIGRAGGDCSGCHPTQADIYK